MDMGIWNSLTSEYVAVGLGFFPCSFSFYRMLFLLLVVSDVLRIMLNTIYSNILLAGDSTEEIR